MSFDPLSRLDGEVAVITGGLGAIGYATAERLAALGASCVLLSRLSAGAGADARAAALPHDRGQRHVALRADIVDSASLRAAAEAVRDSHGRCDILVNSAGHTRPVPAADLDALTDELIDELPQANFRGVFATIRAFAPLLKASGDGLVVNVSSIAGFTGAGSNLAYVAAKAAFDVVGDALAKTLASAVRVVSVSPGAVESGFVPGRGAAFAETMSRTTPLGRIGLPGDVAAAVEALATGDGICDRPDERGIGAMSTARPPKPVLSNVEGPVLSNVEGPVLLPEAALRDRPRSIGFDEAGAVGVPFVTAYEGFRRSGMPSSGQTVLVLGAIGKVGQAAVQLAAAGGARVIAVQRQGGACAGHACAPVEVIDASTEGVAAREHELSAGRGADLVYNTVGSAYFAAANQALAKGATQVFIATHDRAVPFDIFAFYRGRHPYVGIGSLAMDCVAASAQLDAMRDGFERGTLRPFPVARTFGLDDAVVDYRAVLGGSADRIVLHP